VISSLRRQQASHETALSDQGDKEERAKWGFFGAMRSGVRDLFPTRKTKTAMWGVVGLGVLITYMELAAAQLFSVLITGIEDQSASATTVLFVGFLLTFAAIRGISYFQSIYRLTVFEKAFRQINTGSGAAESWRWPMALTLVAIIGQLARLVAITITVAGVSRLFGLLLLACTAVAMVVVNRTGNRQYEIHHQFASAKMAGNPPSAAERIGTRIRAGERAGLVAVIPVLGYVAALGYGATNGSVTTQSALVLFIAGRMAANNYGTLSNAAMRYIRAQVNVEAYGGTATSGGAQTAPAAPADEVVLGALSSGGYLWEPPAQAFARLVDNGLYVGDATVLGRVAREAGFGPQQGLRKHALPARPERIVASGPNETWLHGAYRLPIPGATTSSMLHVIVDGFSRKVLRWSVDLNPSTGNANDFVELACSDSGIDADNVDLHTAVGIVGLELTLYDLLNMLGVTRTLLWTGPSSEEAPQRSIRPAFPTRFDSVADADQWISEFVGWYNDHFYQPEVGYLHPSDVHAGCADQISARRRDVLNRVLGTDGNTYRDGLPPTWQPPAQAWIDPVSMTTIARSVPDAARSSLDEDEEL
jgi:putative transposase